MSITGRIRLEGSPSLILHLTSPLRIIVKASSDSESMAATATASVGPRYAPEDPTLPKPWRGLVDGKTGYLYFWNPETNVTQYERPVESTHGSSMLSKFSSTHVSSSVHVQSSSHGQRGDGHNDDDDRLARHNGTRDRNTRVGTATHNSSDVAVGAGPSGGHISLGVGSGLSAEAYRRRHEISVIGDNMPQPFTSFEVTGFPSEILREVHQAGFSAPTPIQAQSWPIALQGRDIVAIAKTGSGKTLGYLIPGFIHLKRRSNNPQMGPTVLVLSPTRELATQIQEEAVKFGGSSRISCTCLYGGAPKGPQLRGLDKGTDIVVATPGRLNDILEMRRVSLRQVSYLVLDEADRMLDMGFEPQIRKIVKEVPTRRQTLMFTATWPKEVRKIAADLLFNPVQVNIGNVDELVANKSITQYVEVLSPMDKHRRLEQILRSQETGSRIIIFCSTKKMCNTLARNLTRQFGAAAIHGDKSQSDRDHVLNQFRIGRSPVLVATDVAARGLDIKDIRVVINYDFPTGIEDYVHRIGRTGRAGASGVAYTFFCDQDAKYATDLIKILEGANQRVPQEIREMAARSGGTGRFGGRRWGPSSGSRDGGRGGRSDSGYSGRNGGRGGWTSSGRSDAGGRGADLHSRDRYDRGSYDVDGRGRYDRGYQSNNARTGDGNRSFNRGGSRSPKKGTRWGEVRGRDRSRSRSRSRSLERYDRAQPAGSFHQAMIEHSQSKPRFSPARSDKAPPGRSFHEMMVAGHSHASLANNSNIDNAADGDDYRESYDNGPQERARSSAVGPDDDGHSNVGDGLRSYRRDYEEEEEGMIPTDEPPVSQSAD
ncbi:hypothetical protein Nepgr_016217 [Nepenthes gracilis]|uniref:RNA helicase n=1 Tax=Nepenthes gracilis TaxID=150966 RepID=A0AAD3SQ29_NEPGR|nr:hypothetical protein Nepgr_016217 [Nepenthes gracilis]